MKVMIIIGSTREGRQTTKQAKWVFNTARNIEGVHPELVDLADYKLPFFSEPSPRYNPNRQPSGDIKQWLDKVAEFDSYIVVTPEYNHSIPAVLKNALDTIDWQVNRKPAAIVSHGTVGGARAAMHLKEVLSEIKAMPIPNFVALAGMSDAIDEQGKLSENLLTNPYGPQATLESLITELKWYSDALAQARAIEHKKSLAVVN